MKKIHAIILVLFIALHLFGCQKARQLPNGDKEIAENSTLYANNGALIIRHDDSVYFDAEVESNRMLYAADLTNGNVFPVCGKPECLHEDASCNANLNAFSSYSKPAIYNERIYWVEEEIKKDFEYYLYSMTLDGTDRRIEMQLNKEYERLMGISISGIYDGNLYRCGRGIFINGAEVHEGTLIYEQPLEGGMPREILRLNDGNGLAAKFDGHTIYCASFVFSDDADALRLYSYDMEKDELKELYNGEALTDAIGLTVDGDNLIFQGGLRTMSYSLKEGTFTDLFPNAEAGTIHAITDTACVDFTLDELICTDYDGKLIARLPLKTDWLDETVIKYALGSIDGIFYFYLQSTPDAERRFNYLVSFDPSDPKLKLIWKG